MDGKLLQGNVKARGLCAKLAALDSSIRSQQNVATRGDGEQIHEKTKFLTLTGAKESGTEMGVTGYRFREDLW